MRYKIRTESDKTYDTVVEYLAAHQPGTVRVRNPERHIVSAENLSDSTIRALERLGAKISSEYQFSVDRAG